MPRDQEAQAVSTASCASEPFENTGPFGISINTAPMNPITNPKTADRVSGQGTHWEQTREWTGADFWDSEIYPFG